MIVLLLCSIIGLLLRIIYLQDKYILELWDDMPLRDEITGRFISKK